jgi:hypothetical protein
MRGRGRKSDSSSRAAEKLSDSQTSTRSSMKIGIACRMFK